MYVYVSFIDGNEKYFDYTKYISYYPEEYRKRIVTYEHKHLANHAILIYGWTIHNDIEYWIVKDVNSKFSECYYPLSKITDEYWFGIEFLIILI